MSWVPEIGTVMDIAVGYSAGERRYQDCLAGYVEKETENPVYNPKLKAAYDNCKENFRLEYQGCLESVESNHLIVDKPSYCDDKARDEYFEGCLQKIIANYSKNGSSPVENCKRGMTANTLKWSAGMFSGQGE